MNKLLSLPFFVFLYCVPIGISFLLLMIPGLDYLITAYGDWSFRQWEKPDGEEILHINEQEF